MKHTNHISLKTFDTSDDTQFEYLARNKFFALKYVEVLCLIRILQINFSMYICNAMKESENYKV